MTISSLATIMRSFQLGSASEAMAAPPMLVAMAQAIASMRSSYSSRRV
jgi:hypothetical protein